MEEKILKMVRLFLFGTGSYIIINQQYENKFHAYLLIVLLFIIIDIYYPQVKTIKNSD